MHSDNAIAEAAPESRSIAQERRVPLLGQVDTNEKQRLAVLLTCYNRKETTLRCLERLEEQIGIDNVPVSVYLVDDASPDGTGDAVRQAYPGVHVLQGTGSLYWNRGMHMAFGEAIKTNPDFYLWLNDDTMLFPNALAHLLGLYRQLTEDGRPGKIIAGGTGDVQTGAFSYGGVRRIRRPLWWKFQRIAPQAEPVSCDATNGNCVLIPRAVVESVGNLDPIFQHRWGDHDYCFRARAAGCEVWLAPSYIGLCSRNSIQETWKDPKISILRRLRLLWAPSGLQPRDYWIYLRRHRGMLWPLFWLSPFIKIFTSGLVRIATGRNGKAAV